MASHAPVAAGRAVEVGTPLHRCGRGRMGMERPVRRGAGCGRHGRGDAGVVEALPRRRDRPAGGQGGRRVAAGLAELRWRHSDVLPRMGETAVRPEHGRLNGACTGRVVRMVPARLEGSLGGRVRRGCTRAVRYLTHSQRADGSWCPLWFGNQYAPGGENLTYGTARVVSALAAARETLAAEDAAHVGAMVDRGAAWLTAAKNEDGSWGPAGGVAGSIEETALAVEALAAAIGGKVTLSENSVLAPEGPQAGSRRREPPERRSYTDSPEGATARVPLPSLLPPPRGSTSLERLPPEAHASGYLLKKAPSRRETRTGLSDSLNGKLPATHLEAIARGAAWLIERTQGGQRFEAAPSACISRDYGTMRSSIRLFSRLRLGQRDDNGSMT